MPRKKHAYTLRIRQNDALEEAYLYMSWRRRRKTGRRNDVVEEQLSTSRWPRRCRGCGMFKHKEDDMERACLHFETTSWKRLFIIRMMSRNGSCMFSRQDDVAGEACSNVKMSPWKEDPIYSPDSMIKVQCHSPQRRVQFPYEDVRQQLKGCRFLCFDSVLYNDRSTGIDAMSDDEAYNYACAPRALYTQLTLSEIPGCFCDLTM